MNEIQIAKITQVIIEILKSKDIFTQKNIIADKTIYAKEGLYINDFNPHFDFFVKGNSCITGDLKVNGNIIYQKNSSQSLTENTIELSVNPNSLSGLIINSPNAQNGIFWNENEQTFLLGNTNHLSNLNLNNINTNECHSKNLIINDSISSTNNQINLLGNINISQNLTLEKNIFCQSDVLTIHSDLNVNSTFINGFLNVSKNITSHEIKSNSLTSEDIHSTNINSSKINISDETFIGKNLNVQGKSYLEYGFESHQDSEITGDLFLKKNLIFNGINNNIYFTSLSNIENASVSYINGKKVNDNGDILTTEAEQTLSNKILGSNLNCQNFSIKNLQIPIENDDAVPKKYVDQFLYGINLLEPCHCTTTQKLNATFLEKNQKLISNVPEKLIIDGIEVEINQRVLVKNQDSFFENGIYYVVSNGGRNQQWILQYAEDFMEIKNTKERITPLFLSKYGETMGNVLFGLNLITENIFEFMPQNKFLEDYSNMWEKLELKINELNKLCLKLKQSII